MQWANRKFPLDRGRVNYCGFGTLDVHLLETERYRAGGRWAAFEHLAQRVATGDVELI